MKLPALQIAKTKVQIDGIITALDADLSVDSLLSAGYVVAGGSTSPRDAQCTTQNMIRMINYIKRW